MSDILRPEEVEWFNCATRFLEEREAQQPEFSASTTMAALKENFFGQIRFDELSDLEGELRRYFNIVEIPKPKVGEQLKILSLSWLAVTFRNAHSSFFLAQNGYRDTSVANSRVALEHSIYLSLLASGRDRDRIASRMEGLYLKFHKGIGDDLSTSDLAIDEFFRLALEELPNVDPGRKNWSDVGEQVCNLLDSGDVVYSNYRILSNMMHPGFASSEPFVYSVKYDESANCTWAPVINPANTVAFMAVASCVWAAWSIEHLFEEEYFERALDPIANRLKLHRLFRE
ncbi:MAG: hypothetical protein HIU84_12825 [Acidobacteria bacterium]|nr:hypothetical protein [Acidobacteriota bacterium]